MQSRLLLVHVQRVALSSPALWISINLNKLIKPVNGNRGNTNRRMGGNRQRDRRQVIAAPPSLDATILCTKRFRFTFDAAVTTPQVISASDIVRFLTFSVGTTEDYPIIDRFRIELIELYGPMSSSLEPVTVTLEWVASASGFSVPTKKRSDTSMSSACCAYISYRPDRDALSGEWMSGSVGGLFNVSGPDATIMDVVVLFALNDGTPILGNSSDGFIGTQAPTGMTPLGWKSV